MAGFRTPGPQCGDDGVLIDEGTLCRALTPLPGPLCRVPSKPERAWHLYSTALGFAPSTLRLGPDGVTLLKAVERLALKPYDDQTGEDITAWVAGATIGYGHLITAADWALYQGGLTAAAADALFLADLAPFEQGVGDVVTQRLQQYQFDALVILAFNIGLAGFKSSSVVKLVNDPKASTAYASLKDAWLAWNKSQGKVMKGLDNRRRCEWAVYTTAVYALW